MVAEISAFNLFWNDHDDGSLARLRICRRQEMITRNKNAADFFFVTISWHGWRDISCACENERKWVTDTLGETWNSPLMRRNHNRLLVVSWSSILWTCKPSRPATSKDMSMPIIMKCYIYNADGTWSVISGSIETATSQHCNASNFLCDFCLRCKRHMANEYLSIHCRCLRKGAVSDVWLVKHYG
jgi:hypothetical protein